MSAPADGYLMRFEDGPMTLVGNVSTAESALGGEPVAPGNMVVPREMFGWPLPDRLAVLCHPGVAENVAMWRADGDGEGLPLEIAQSPNRVVYVKVAQSQLPDDSFAYLMRGAVYRIEVA